MVKNDVLVVGGGGHIGLPLSLFLANRGMEVTILDISTSVVESIRNKTMPFHEPGCQELLSRVIDSQALKVFATLSHSDKRRWSVAIVIIGTQLLSSGEPDRDGVLSCIEEIHQHLDQDALLILRSTVFPGTTELVQNLLVKMGRGDVKVIFAPERIAEGFALAELESLPQIIGADTDYDFGLGKTFFERIGNSVLPVKTKEAEFIKLATNAYRFAHFALGNAIYLAAQKENFNYSIIMETMVKDYPRLSSLPKPGYVGGPCLIKDTVQLQSFLGGTNAMTDFSLNVNFELTQFTIDRIVQKALEAKGSVIGFLGIAFKPESDDIRDSPILIVMQQLITLGYTVKYFDPYATSESFEFQNLNELLSKSDILVLGTPHKEFIGLELNRPLVNVWN
jgi:UDP-N-acetyl-D-mannosaminuronic acid dehydrogenase